MKEFSEEQKALGKIKDTTKQMEKSKGARTAEARKLEDELDDVPTRDKPKKNVGRPMSSSIGAHLSGNSMITSLPTYNPSRVKGSIPKQTPAPKPKKSMKQSIQHNLNTAT